MSLQGSQFEQLQAALISAYDAPSLAQMVRFALGEELAVIAGGANFSQVVFELIRWAERTGQTQALVAAAVAGNPGNPRLKRYAEQHLGATDGNPPAAGQAGAHGLEDYPPAQGGNQPRIAIDTDGGTFIGGNVAIGGNFVGRDHTPADTQDHSAEAGDQ